MPDTSDAGFLYYHTDDVTEVPATWQEVYEDAAKKDGIVYQGAAYEGLTCDFLEIAFAAGGKVLSEDGKKSEFDSPENVKALQFMVDGIKDGAAPKAVTTYMEEQARRAFEAGRATFMRNWPYAYALGKKNKNAPQFEVAPFPRVRGRRQGRHPRRAQPRRSRSTRRTRAARSRWSTTAPARRTRSRRRGDFSLPGALSSAYDDPEVQKALPFADELKQAIEQAKSRPVSPVYPQISRGDLQERQRGAVGRDVA